MGEGQVEHSFPSQGRCRRRRRARASSRRSLLAKLHSAAFAKIETANNRVSEWVREARIRPLSQRKDPKTCRRWFSVPIRTLVRGWYSLRQKLLSGDGELNRSVRSDVL